MANPTLEEVATRFEVEPRAVVEWIAGGKLRWADEHAQTLVERDVEFLARRGPNRPQHNHVTRDIKQLGECPACDVYLTRGDG